MISIISCNVNGLRSAVKKGFRDWLLKESPDIICLQETKGHEADLQECLVQDYHPYFYSAQKKGYSGVAIFSKVKPIHLERGLCFPYCDDEGRYIEADFGTFSVGSLYLPSGTSGEERQAVKYQFMEKMRPFLEKKQLDKKPFIICGDFNIVRGKQDIKNFTANQKNTGCLPEERAWMNALIEEQQWIDTFRTKHPDAVEYSWWSQRAGARKNNVGWRIDYQLASMHLKEAIVKASIYNDQVFSDHAPVVVHYDL